MPDLIPIPPPRTPFLDPRTGMISREWYQFFMQIKSATDGSFIDGDMGDITVSSGTWTIDTSVVTYPKIQNVSPNSLLGRTTIAGIVEEIPCTVTARMLLDDGSVAEMRSTLELGSAALYPASAFMSATASLGFPSQLGHAGF